MRRFVPYAACALALAMGCTEKPVRCEQRDGYMDSYYVAWSSSPRDFATFAGALYFTARDASSPQAWRLYRLVPGTAPVPIEAAPSSPDDQGLLAPLAPYGDSLYAFRYPGLWRVSADGTLTQAPPVYYRELPSDAGEGPYPAVFAGALYFQAMTPSGDMELMRYDGTTVEVAADIFDDGLHGSYPSHLTVLGGTLYFFAGDLVNGRALWAFDGANATLEYDFDPYSKDFGAYPEAILGARGQDLLLIVGPGDRLVSYQPGGTPVTIDTNVTSALLVGSTLLYSRSGGELYREDGAGPVWLRSGAWVRRGAQLGGALYVVADTGRPVPYVEEGELLAVLPDRVVPLLTGAAITTVQDVVAFDGALYLSATDLVVADAPQEGVVGRELWRFDPVTGGLTLVADLYPGWNFACIVD